MGTSTEKGLLKAVVRAKLTQPALPIGYVGRAALLKRLELLARQKLTLVGAPTGYGKTGLMVEFARKKADEGALVSWLTVDEEDADFARFCRHIVAALAGLGAQVAAEIEPLVDEERLERGAGLDDGALVAMGNALFEALPPGMPCYLLIDDYGCADQQGRDEQLLRFCSLTPPDFHVVLASSAFSWVLQTDAYRLGYGCLGVEDLALTRDEARHLANAMCDEPPSDEALEKACRFVEGWPQGLVLAARSLSGARSADDVRLDGSLLNVRRYFQAQVTRLVTGDLFSFMLEISVLETFSRPLCEAVFGSGSTQALLDELIRRNLFVVPCDEEGTWFRFNALFADWLRSELLQLRIEEIRQTCARASEWFHDYGMQDEAAKYLLLASDFDYVANLTEATCSLSRSDKRTHYLLWLCRIPSAEFASSPLLCMLSAWSCITNARVADAQNWIARFERSMQEPAHAGSLDPSIVEFSSKCLKMKCVAMEGDGQEALAQCDELLNSGYEIKPSLMSMIYQSLGEAYERIGDMAQARRFTCKPRQAQAWTLRCTSCCSTRSTSPRCSTASASSPKPARVARSFCERALPISRSMVPSAHCWRACCLSATRRSGLRFWWSARSSGPRITGTSTCTLRPGWPRLACSLREEAFPRRTRSSSRASCMASRRTFREPCCCVPTSNRRR